MLTHCPLSSGQNLRNLLVDTRTANTTKELYDRNLSAKTTPYTAKLESDNASSDDDHLFWDLLQGQCARRADNLLLVDFDGSSGEWRDLGTSSDDDVLCLHFSLTTF